MKWSKYAPRVNSGAPAADFADRAGRSLDIGIILAPNPDLVAGAGTPTGVDDALGRVLGRRVLMRTSFGHAVTTLRHDTGLYVPQWRRHTEGSRTKAARRGCCVTGGIPAEALLDLRRRLDQLPQRHGEERTLVNGAAQLFGVSCGEAETRV
jgi:hypothetical protein